MLFLVEPTTAHTSLVLACDIANKPGNSTSSTRQLGVVQKPEMGSGKKKNLRGQFLRGQQFLHTTTITKFHSLNSSQNQSALGHTTLATISAVNILRTGCRVLRELGAAVWMHASDNFVFS